MTAHGAKRTWLSNGTNSRHSHGGNEISRDEVLADTAVEIPDIPQPFQRQKEESVLGGRLKIAIRCLKEFDLEGWAWGGAHVRPTDRPARGFRGVAPSLRRRGESPADLRSKRIVWDPWSGAPDPSPAGFLEYREQAAATASPHSQDIFKALASPFA